MMCHNETAKKDQRGAIKDNPLRDQHILQTNKRDYYRLNKNNIIANLLLSPDKKTAYIKNNKSTKNYKWDVKQLTPSIPRRQQQDEKRIELPPLLLVPPLFDEYHSNNNL